jgi:hypothetical protein
MVCLADRLARRRHKLRRLVQELDSPATTLGKAANEAAYRDLAEKRLGGKMAKYNLKRIDLYVPQYRTNATITIDENYSSGQPHLVVRYEKGGYKGQKDVAAAIPPDWTDQDLAELIFLPLKPRADRNWPAWEIPAADHASPHLFRFWKGEKPPTT